MKMNVYQKGGILCAPAKNDLLESCYRSFNLFQA